MYEAPEVIWVLQSREDKVTVHKELGLEESFIHSV